MRHLLLGTDWGEDCDDAVAVRILARKHKAGEIDLCGIGVNTRFAESVPALVAFLDMGVDRIYTDDPQTLKDIKASRCR